MEPQQASVDISSMYSELDRLNDRLCRCQHRQECLACRGFEVLRQQSRMIVCAASQPALMQIAQEAAATDLIAQLAMQAKLAADPHLLELVSQLIERVQQDLGGPEQLQRLFGSCGRFPGFPGG